MRTYTTIKQTYLQGKQFVYYQASQCDSEKLVSLLISTFPSHSSKYENLVISQLLL